MASNKLLDYDCKKVTHKGAAADVNLRKGKNVKMGLDIWNARRAVVKVGSNECLSRRPKL